MLSKERFNWRPISNHYWFCTNEVYKEFAVLAGLTEMSTSDIKDAGSKKMNPIQRFVKMLSDCFIPIIPTVAGGLLMGINNILTASDLFIKGKSLIKSLSRYGRNFSGIN